MLNKLKQSVTYFTLLWVMRYLNFISKIKSHFHTDNILLETPYTGQKILLIALYEKGKLRNDIARLLLLAKQKGLYIIGVNTLRLASSTDFSRYFDCYIEKYNHGRDFGSYKTGFEYFYKHQLDKTCPRLLMVNDSVFYESTRCNAFINELMQSNIQVLGATENLQFKHHLGSFCISFDSYILKHAFFQQFWIDYKSTNIRPITIKKGEKELSKVLKKIASSHEQFRAIYDLPFVVNKLDTDSHLIEQFLELSLKPVFAADGTRLSANALLSDFVALNYPIGTMQPLLIEASQKECSLKAMVSYLKSNYKIIDERIEQKLHVFLKSIIADRFCMGSQIHTNAEILLLLGMPLIKLDINYRGVFNTYDIMALINRLQPAEAQELQDILLKRIYYRKTSTRWNKMLADYGFL